MKSANGIEIKVGQRAMVLRNDEDNPVVDSEGPPAFEDAVGVLGVVMYVRHLGESQVFLQDKPDDDESTVMGWWNKGEVVILREARA